MNFKAFIFLVLLFSAAALLFCSTSEAETSQLDLTKSNVAEESNKAEDIAKHYKYCKHRCRNPYRGCWCCSASEAQLMGSQVKTDDNGEESNRVEDAKYYKCKHRCCNPYKGCWCCSGSEAAQLMEGSNSGGEGVKGGHGNEGQPREVEN